MERGKEGEGGMTIASTVQEMRRRMGIPWREPVDFHAEALGFTVPVLMADLDSWLVGVDENGLSFEAYTTEFFIDGRLYYNQVERSDVEKRMRLDKQFLLNHPDLQRYRQPNGAIMSVHDAQPSDIYVDANGKLWRVVMTCSDPTVTVEEVEAETGASTPGKGRRSGAVSGAMWLGFKRIYRPEPPK
jgi:hypothetical protein